MEKDVTKQDIPITGKVKVPKAKPSKKDIAKAK